MRYYSEDHVWVHLDNGTATLGISRHAAEELGEITFVELPPAGTRVARHDVLCVVESAKTAADVGAPLSGTVAAANRGLEEQPGLVTSSPEDEGWLCTLVDLDPAELSCLLSAEAYAALLAGQAGR